MAKIKKTDEQWRKELGEERYKILREKGTEIPDTGELLHTNETGDYTCAACGAVVFKSDSKYDSTTPGLIGWPSFSEAADSGAIELREDNSMWMKRTEAVCTNCDSHLGHLFPDESSPNGQHYCINSLSLKFEPKK